MSEFDRLVAAVVLLAQVSSQLIAAYQSSTQPAALAEVANQVEAVVAAIQAAITPAPVG